MKHVFDCFMYNGESDVLTIRLHELDSVVDTFVIIEATKTHANQPREIHYSPKKFPEFAHKIRHLVIADMPDDLNGMVRDRFQRDAIMRVISDASPLDLVIISDVDEIPRSSVVKEMIGDKTHPAFGVRLALSYFYINYCNTAGTDSNLTWTVAAVYSYLLHTTPTNLRLLFKTGHMRNRIFDNGGWHFSYLTDLEGVKKKIVATAHQEVNKPSFLSTVDIDKIISNRQDLFDRPGYVWDVISSDDLPEWLLANRDSMSHLFYQDKANATA